ncbi:complement C4-like [Acipenser ruthenus]|uniref:complement C4-like n=1 Tax=Acipenser ruthenus TaxID=7906 RepID=UPI00274243B0|nr:complement C4-like [Acipenser ruthenus]
METPVSLLLLCSCLAAVLGEQAFFIAAPSVVHFGVVEWIGVQLQKGYPKTSVRLYFEEEITKTRCSQPVNVEVGGSDDNIQTRVALKLDTEKVRDLAIYKDEVPYLLLVAEMGNQRKIVRVLLSKKMGYIFIQTDQPIYTPSEKVQFRVFTLDHTMKPTEKSVSVSVFNSLGNRVFHKDMRSVAGVVSQHMMIPDVTDPGTWKIVAHYQDGEKTAESQNFEVRKFVLPSFDVQILPQTMYYHVKEEEFSFMISVTYTYGEKVNGSAHVRFGIIDEAGKTTFMKGLEQNQQVRDGEAKFKISSRNLTAKLGKSMSDLVDFRLYIAVTVIETSSGELQEADLKSVVFVDSRLRLDLTKTKKFLIPGVPFRVWASVTFADGTPASDKLVEVSVSDSGQNVQRETSRTNKEGTVVLDINVPGTVSMLDIKASVSDEGETSQAQMQASLYNSQSKSYLYIRVQSAVIQPGEGLKIGFKANSNQLPSSGFFYYMLVSRGQISRLGKLQLSNLAEVSETVTPDLIPSFRIVGFYFTANHELVADSVWVDVQDTCEGTLAVKADKGIYSPGNTMKVTLHTGADAPRVALLAVDTAMYALNRDNRVTSRKVFAAMNSYDIGCSFGGGANNVGVFNDAGLSFITNQVTSQMRKGFACDTGFRRQTRSLDIQAKIVSKVNEYTDDKLKRCCKDGFTLLPMKSTCKQRANRVRRRRSQQCSQVFLECCLKGEELRKKQRNQQQLKGVARSTLEEEDDFLDESYSSPRQFFPRSWMWDIVDTTKGKMFQKPIPDSITTWEIQAISFSPTKGFCVADPSTVTVFKEVFVSLRLPYSVKRFEQLEVRAVIYNYMDQMREMSVHLRAEEGLCAPATGSLGRLLRVTVPPRSSLPVFFSVVPMKLGEIPVSVRLFDKESSMGVDSVIKLLRVVAEGVEMRVEETHNIDPADKKLRLFSFDGVDPPNTVPDSQTSIFMRVSGQVFNKERVENLFSPQGIRQLIRMPTGCGEQTMISMGPAAYSTRYLDHSKQWKELPAGLRDQALEFIRAGYTRILTYKKKDGSYGAWIDYGSSTWLTAFVLKTLSQVRSYADVQNEEIEDPASYLLTQQLDSGEFHDPKPVIHREMQGGVGGVDSRISLTAFVTIALHHSLAAQTGEKLQRVKDAIDKSTEYLQDKILKVNRPYSLAISAYALALTKPESSAAHQAVEILKSQAIEDREKGVVFWEADSELRLQGEDKAHLVPQAQAITVETTAYGLLAALANREQELAESVYRWLSEQQNYGGGFRSTQDTVVALEALSEFEIRKDPNIPPPKLEIKLSSLGKNLNQRVTLETSAIGVEEDLRRFVGNTIDINVGGSGKGSFTVLKIYNSMEPKTSCSDLKIEVTVTGKVKYTPAVVDYYEYEDGEEPPQSDQAMSELDWFDARSRRKRDATGHESSKKSVVNYQVCIWHSSAANLSGMAIADITMLSGFEADTEDLDKLKGLADQYINHYESTEGRLLLYFDGIPPEQECIEFGAKQIIPIGLVQPATATLYDYYEPDRKCTTFYNAPGRSTFVSTLCSGEVCQCAEKPCHKQQETYSKKLTKDLRMSHACFDPIVNYGYTVKVLSIVEQNNFQVYKCTITRTLQYNRDELVAPGSIRFFLKRRQCKGSLSEDQQYLIMGNDGKTTDQQGHMQYLLDSSSWIEELPNEEKCRGSAYRRYCKGLTDFLDEYESSGCTV